MPNTNTDQIRQLVNRVHLAGYLAELSEPRTGTTSSGIPYLSFDGAIQCGEDAVDVVKFRTFVKSKKADGSDSKNFEKVSKWVKTAVPMTRAQDKDSVTMVDCFGSVTDNPYVNNAGKLVETVQFNIQSFGDFQKFTKELELEGYVLGVTEETRGEDAIPTGRGRLRLMTRDIFRSILEIKNIVVPEDLYTILEESGYVQGVTTTINIDLMPNIPMAKVKTGGIGKQHETQGKRYLEWTMVGASEIVDPDSEDAIPTAIAKKAMNERKAKLQEIEANGYLGNNTSTTTTSSGSSRSRTGLANQSASAKAAPKADNSGFEEIKEADPDDFPF